jgi:hypothetical protein
LHLAISLSSLVKLIRLHQLASTLHARRLVCSIRVIGAELLLLRNPGQINVLLEDFLGGKKQRLDEVVFD